MKRIAIDISTLNVYEEMYGTLVLILPPPFISVAAPVEPDASVRTQFDLRDAKHVFREDSFDPVTRIRRGRFYECTSGPYPATRFTAPDPRCPGGGLWEKRLFIFDQVQQSPLVSAWSAHRTVMLGSTESVWRMLSVERISTGEWLVTLKARHALGVLPEIDQAKIPEAGRTKAIETIDTLINAAYRESPESIVDRARAAAQWCFATWAAAKFKDGGLLTSELAPLADVVEKRSGMSKPDVSIWTARGLARLHSRAKPNEQERRDTRPVMEADAEYALAAMGLLLRELGWTV